MFSDVKWIDFADDTLKSKSDLLYNIQNRCKAALSLLANNKILLTMN